MQFFTRETLLALMRPASMLAVTAVALTIPEFAAAGGGIPALAEAISGPICLMTDLVSNDNMVAALFSVAIIVTLAMSLLGQIQVGTVMKIIGVMAIIAGIGAVMTAFVGHKCTGSTMSGGAAAGGP